MLLWSIDNTDNIYVVVSDIPGAFLHAGMSENIHILLDGTIAEMIAK